MREGGVSGVEATEIIRQSDKEISIIFTTSTNALGPATYDVAASYYIVKPVARENIEKAMDVCRAKLNDYARAIEVMENRQLITVRLRDVHYIEAMGHNSIVHTASGGINTRTAFFELAEKIGGSSFIACHRSYIVNLVHVADMKESAFIMKNGSQVPISKKYQDDVQKAFSAFFWET